MPEKAKSPGHREDILLVLSEMFATHPQVRPGKMFGFPAFYTGRKLFCCVYGDGVSLKLPIDKIKEIDHDRAVHPFEPYGKARMKEWVYIIHEDPEDYRDLSEMFEQSISYVNSSTKTR